MATGKISNPQASAGQIQTWRQSYKAAWEVGFGRFMFLMAEQYKITLYAEVNGQDLPSPVMDEWRQSLSELSPSEMIAGLRGYRGSERGSFPPTPEEIIDNAKSALPDPKDKPRAKINPNCPDCSGTGWRPVEAEGKRRGRVTRCECRVVEYQGQIYTDASHQLPAPNVPEAGAAAGNDVSAMVARLDRHSAMPEPRREFRGAVSEAELERQKREVLAKYGAK